MGRQGDSVWFGARQARRVADAAPPWLVGGFYVLIALDWLSGDSASRLAAGLVLAVAAGVLLGWRRRRPEAVMAAILPVDALMLVLVPELVIPIASLFAIWALAAWRPRRVSLVGLAGLLMVCAVNFHTSTVEDAFFMMAIAIAVWALAEASRSRRNAIEEAARRAAGEEQARIARELHDVIAHSVSVIVVQAGAAGDAFDSRPDQARAALRSIEEAGRDALRELRRLLSPVHSPDGTTPPAPPPPGLAQIEDLAAPLRAAGLNVVVTQEGEPRPLPAGVDLSAYRIVQEALTNTLRHGRATVAEVTLRYRSDGIEVDIVDDGRGAPPRVGGGGQGYGLIGMRERAALVGGSLAAGPTPHGGFRVSARLPLDGAR